MADDKTWTDEQMKQRDAIWNAAEAGEDDPLILIIDGQPLTPLTMRLLEEKKILLAWVDDLENEITDLQTALDKALDGRTGA